MNLLSFWNVEFNSQVTYDFFLFFREYVSRGVFFVKLITRVMRPGYCSRGP